MLVAELSDGDADGAVSFGKLGEGPVDGVGEDGPEVFLSGGRGTLCDLWEEFFAGLR